MNVDAAVAPIRGNTRGDQRHRQDPGPGVGNSLDDAEPDHRVEVVEQENSRSGDRIECEQHHQQPQLARLARLRNHQHEHDKLEAHLQREKQFNRKVALNAQLRDLKDEIDRLSA